jgi:hypothetical protein
MGTAEGGEGGAAAAGGGARGGGQGGEGGGVGEGAGDLDEEAPSSRSRGEEGILVSMRVPSLEGFFSCQQGFPLWGFFFSFPFCVSKINFGAIEMSLGRCPAGCGILPPPARGRNHPVKSPVHVWEGSLIHVSPPARCRQGP